MIDNKMSKAQLAEENVERLLKSIESFLKADDEELKKELHEFEEIEFLVKQVNKFEKTIAKLLKKQKKLFISELKKYVAKSEGNILIQQVLEMVMSDVFEADTFAEDMSEEASKFLYLTIPQLVTVLMENIDKDIAFNTLSKRTTDFIDDWSPKLGDLMKLSSHDGVQNVITQAIKEGKGMPYIIDELEKLPQFDRLRAERTAITETLTAYSRSQYEAYTQSPSVTKKKWKHSGAKNINPRKHHVAYSGTEVEVDEYFTIGGSQCLYPRDPSLPARERVKCHCVMGPVVDEAILGLNKEEKEVLRQQALNSLNE